MVISSKLAVTEAVLCSSRRGVERLKGPSQDSNSKRKMTFEYPLFITRELSPDKANEKLSDTASELGLFKFYFLLTLQNIKTHKLTRLPPLLKNFIWILK